MIAPILDQIAAEYAGKVLVAKMNVDENPRTPMKFSVRSIPTLILFKNGQLQGQKIGAVHWAASRLFWTATCERGYLEQRTATARESSAVVGVVADVSVAARQGELPPDDYLMEGDDLDVHQARPSSKPAASR